MYTIMSEKVVKGFNVREAAWDGFGLQLLLAPNAPRDGEYLPAKVTKGGEELWSFKRAHPYYRGLAQLVDYEEELVLVLATRFAIDLVIPVRDLPHIQKVGNEFVGGRKLKEIVSMKGTIAKSFGRRPNWTKREAEMLRVLEQAESAAHAEATKQVQAERQAARRAEEERREQERAEREARRTEILSRKKIVAFTATGERRIGTPVVGEEWMALRNGAFCILVSSYDKKTGAVGDPVESFAVEKKGSGNPTRRSIAMVTPENVKPIGKPSVITALKTAIIVIKDEPEEVIVADTLEQVKVLCAQGLNSGTLVMAPKANDTGRFVVYCLKDGMYESVTEVKRLSA